MATERASPGTIEDIWQSYAASVEIPVGGIQWKETRLAFFSAIWAFMQDMKRASYLEGSASADWLCGREDECLDFMRRHFSPQLTPEINVLIQRARERNRGES